MKEITQEVLNGTYEKPLGLGVLDWRGLSISPIETKHIVESDGWFFYMKRHTIQELAVITSVDIKNTPTSLIGLPELLEVRRVYMYSKLTVDERLSSLGFKLGSVRYRLSPNPNEKKPVNMTEDCLLTDAERDSYILAAENSSYLKNAMEMYALGTAKFHRVDYGGGRSSLILVGEEPNGLDLLSHFSEDIEGDMFAGDMFAYLCSQHPLGGEYAIGVESFEEPTPIALTLETHGAKASGIFIISKGDSNAG